MAPLRVLFFVSDPLTAEVRLRPLLDVLRAKGKLRGYAIVDRDMAASGDTFDQYDVLLAHRNLSTRQIMWLRNHSPPFLYDLDDLLLDAPGAVPQGKQATEQASIAWCLAHASVVSSPSRRLLSALGARLATGLGARGLYLPNAGVEMLPPIKPVGKPRLLWVASAAASATDELEDVCRGVAEAARDIDTDVVLIGRFPAMTHAAFARTQRITWLPHLSYLRFLAEGPYIGVVPLNTGLAPDSQAFVDCKSDIKVAQYGSSRIAGAYSPAPPYRESDLPCFTVSANTAAGWRDGLLTLAADFPARGNRLAEHPAFAARRPSVIADQMLDVLIAASATGRPFTFRAIPTPSLGRRLERRIRRLRRSFFAKLS